MEPVRPYIIAHRGASGYLPEHTREAYAYAHALGVDYIELDVVLTRDAVPVCLHDPWLDDISNGHAVYPHRARSNGRLYVVDLTWDEIRRVQLRERLPGRFPQEPVGSSPQALRDIIALIHGLNNLTGRRCGLFVELKDTHFHAAEGLDVTSAMFTTLMADVPEPLRHEIYIQCFEHQAVHRLHHSMHAPFPLLQLMWEDPEYDAMTTDAGLDKLARHAAGISVSKEMLFRDPGLCARAKVRDLMVNVWTFRAETLAEEFTSLEDELTFVMNTFEVDGIITDHPDRAMTVRNHVKGKAAP